MVGLAINRRECRHVVAIEAEDRGTLAGSQIARQLPDHGVRICEVAEVGGQIVPRLAFAKRMIGSRLPGRHVLQVQRPMVLDGHREDERRRIAGGLKFDLNGIGHRKVGHVGTRALRLVEMADIEKAIEMH